MNLKFAERVDPLFDFVLEILERAEAGEDPDPEEVREEILKRLQDADQVLGKSQKWHDAWQLARYAVVAWIDEVLVDGCAWDAADAWSQHLLEIQLNGVTPQQAGTEFFDRAKVAATQNQHDALEVFYLAVILGYRGHFRQLSETHDQQRPSPVLKEWLTTTFEACIKPQPGSDVPYSAKPADRAEPLTGRQQLLSASTAMIWLLAATVLVAALHLYVPRGQQVRDWIRQHWRTVVGAAVITAGLAHATRMLIRHRILRTSAHDADINAAFHTGLRELKRHGLSSPDIPVFLVLGTPDVDTARAVMESSDLDFKVHGFPTGESPLVWYASPRAIFLACPGAGEVSALAAASSTLHTALVATLGADAAESEPSQRLQAVCELLRTSRQPNCGIHGILSFLPQHLVTGDPQVTTATHAALAADNRTLVQTLQQRAHAVMLIGNLQQHPGFLKLVQRFGREISNRNRLGKGAPGPWCEPMAETIDAVTRAACQAITDNVFQLFRRDHNLETIGNSHLYRLVCFSRHQLSVQLGDVVRDAYRGSFTNGDWSLPISGCYFAATGQRADERAFAASAFQKLMQCSKLVDWQPAARQSDLEQRRRSRLIWVGNLCVSLILALMLILSAMF